MLQKEHFIISSFLLASFTSLLENVNSRKKMTFVSTVIERHDLSSLSAGSLSTKL